MIATETLDETKSTGIFLMVLARGADFGRSQKNRHFNL